MPTVLAQSNLPKSAAVIVSSETIILRDPNNSILEKYTSEEQKQLSLKSYGIRPATMLSPGENKKDPSIPPFKIHEYITNDGVAYINTGMHINTSESLEIDYEPISGPRIYFCGSMAWIDEATENKSRYTAFITTLEASSYQLRIYASENAEQSTVFRNRPLGRKKLLVSKGKVYVDNNLLGNISPYTENLTVDNDFLIMACRNIAELQQEGQFRLYSFAIYNADDTIKHYFVPATRDDVPGLLDIITSHFYENASSDGNLVVGGEVSPDIPTISNLQINRANLHMTIQPQTVDI